jgi:AcrR family transcriptional regulator
MIAAPALRYDRRMAGTDDGLRERKKQRTREAIVDAALRLFEERGFERTTIADVAAAADIAPRTFFGYFRTKEDVLFDDFEPTRASLAARLDGRPEGESAIDALRAWIEQLIAQTDFDDEREFCRRRLVLTTPVLAAYERGLMAQFESTLAGAVARDLGDPPDGVRPRMVAAAATAALLSTESYYKDEGREHAQLGKAASLALLDDALTFLRGGLGALQRGRDEAPVEAPEG